MPDSENDPPPPPPQSPSRGHGNVPQLKSEDPESFQLWQEMFGFYLEANGVTDPGKKRAILCGCGGELLLKVIMKQCLPQKPAEVPYDEIISKVESYFDPRPMQFVQQLRFSTLMQEEGEPFKTYLARLRQAAEGCGYAANQDREISSQILRGLRDKKLALDILSSGKLELQRVIEHIDRRETAVKTMDELGARERQPDTLHYTQAAAAVSQARYGGNPHHQQNPKKALLEPVTGEVQQTPPDSQQALSYSQQVQSPPDSRQAMSYSQQMQVPTYFQQAPPYFQQVPFYSQQTYAPPFQHAGSNYSQQAIPCYHCDGPHASQTCKFRSSQCSYCGKRGHLYQACYRRKEGKPPLQQAHSAEQASSLQNRNYAHRQFPEYQKFATQQQPQQPTHPQQNQFPPQHQFPPQQQYVAQQQQYFPQQLAAQQQQQQQFAVQQQQFQQQPQQQQQLEAVGIYKPKKGKGKPQQQTTHFLSAEEPAFSAPFLGAAPIPIESPEFPPPNTPQDGEPSLLFQPLEHHELYHIRSSEDDPVLVSVLLDDVHVKMEVDSGSLFSLIGKSTYERHFKDKPLGAEKVILSPWGKDPMERLKSLGSIQVRVRFNGRDAVLPLLVLDKDGPSLIGRHWWKQLGIGLTGVSRDLRIHKFSHKLPPQISEFTLLFSPGMGKYNGPPAHIYLKPNTIPVYLPARKPPLTSVQAIDQSIDAYEKYGIWQPVPYSLWATPLVSVIKPDKTARLCGDYSCTVNKHCERQIFPIASVEEVLLQLAGGKFFSKMDLSHAFTQIPVDEETSELLTINSSKGLYRVNRLSAGLACAPAIFQRILSSVLGGLRGVICYMDDVLVQAPDLETMWDRVRSVLQRLQSAGFRLKIEKCEFAVTELDFVGYHVTPEGVSPMEAKVSALLATPSPANVEQLRTCIGYVTYYDRFFPNRAEQFRPLYELANGVKPFEWTQVEEDCMQSIKEVMSKKPVLTHFDPNLPIVLACDASPHGVGAVLSHVKDGEERPVWNASKTLHGAELNYSQLDKEALSIIFGVKKFHKLLFGLEFTILTDHKPLLAILGEHKPTPALISPRLVRWKMLLSSYDYKLVYRSGKSHQNADFFSRFPVEDLTDCTEQGELYPEPAVRLLQEAPASSPLSAASVAAATAADPVLSQARRALQQGWAAWAAPPEIKNFLTAEPGTFTVMHGCILRGNNVVIPEVLRPEVLKLLHAVHQGISRTKALARSYVWWEGLDRDIEELVRTCTTCSESRPRATQAPIIPWSTPHKVWSRIHIDYAGPMNGENYLIVVDALSKWVEVFNTKSSTSTATTIKCLRTLFAQEGYPDEVVSDNGPAFRSQEFTDFLNSKLIKHIKTAPYCPESNGQAERTVQSVKGHLKRLQDTELDLQDILLTMRTTPNPALGGMTPAELMRGRKITTLLDKIHPGVFNEKSSYTMQQAVDSTLATPKYRQLEDGDAVFYRGYRQGRPWLKGTISATQGPRNFLVLGEDGQEERRHLGQIRRRYPAQVEDRKRELLEEAIMRHRHALYSAPSSSTPSKEEPSSKPESVPSSTATPVSSRELTAPSTPLSTPAVSGQEAPSGEGKVMSGSGPTTATAVTTPGAATPVVASPMARGGPYPEKRKSPPETPKSAATPRRRSKRQAKKPHYLSDYVS